MYIVHWVRTLYDAFLFIYVKIWAVHIHKPQSTRRVAIATFWRTFHHDKKKLPNLLRVPTPLHCLYHHIQSCGVYAPAERADALPIFLLYANLYSVGQTEPESRTIMHICTNLNYMDWKEENRMLDLIPALQYVWCPPVVVGLSSCELFIFSHAVGRRVAVYKTQLGEGIAFLQRAPCQPKGTSKIYTLNYTLFKYRTSVSFLLDCPTIHIGNTYSRQVRCCLSVSRVMDI